MSRRELGREAALVVGWFLVLGVAGGVVWWLVTPLAEWTRTAESATMDEPMLGVSVAADGWFFVIAGASALVSGFVLAAWRKRDPLLTVVLIAAGACAASLVMYLVGHLLGPGSYQAALEQAEVGEKVPVPLEVKATGIYLVWPIGALFTALAVLWGTSDDTARVEEDPNSPRAPLPNG